MTFEAVQKINRQFSSIKEDYHTGKVAEATYISMLTRFVAKLKLFEPIKPTKSISLASVSNIKHVTGLIRLIKNELIKLNV